MESKMKFYSKKRIIKLIKHLAGFDAKNKRKANEFAVKFYREHKHEKIEYMHNYWSKNKYWDFFYHSLPHVKPSNKFIPRDYYASIVEATLENSRFGDFATEKNYYDKLFTGHGVIIPRTYYKVIDGVLLDEDFKRIQIDDIHKILNNKQVIIKDTLSSSGVGVKKIEVKDGVYGNEKESFTYPDLVKQFKGNFICQEVIHQHPFLEAFHPDSLNTFRIFTYKSVVNNQVHVTLATFKMGVKGSSIDNVSAGGIAVGIDLGKGCLMKYALDNYGKSCLEHSDTKIRFENTPVPYFAEMIAKAKELADVLSHARLIGWDVTLSEKGEVILVEPNIGIGAWAMQITSGTPLLGEFSDEVRDYILKHKHQ